ncbi:MAG: DEAD/DEAH box family ATP-dependent RNA helicase [Nitrospinaceae bacterium]|nr:MAG: DEAD/DEAH box family ATP-dependent RNA helicase [Nitrospinaceae bacterium]
MHSSISPVRGGFDNLNLIGPICRAVREEKYAIPTPIQMQAIPHLLEGRDLLGCAQTGTGKTAAFALPILQRLAESPNPPGPKGMRALILTPTRELAVQISDSFRIYGRYLKLGQTVIYGGVNYPSQIRALSRGLDIVVATPGRLLDLFDQGYVRMDKIDVMVLDEADRMLDMGFLPDIRKIFSAIPAERQTMLFSATLPEEIVKITKRFLNDPVRVSVSPPSSTVEKIDQRVLFVDRENKSALLDSVLQDESFFRVLVFARTKHGSNRIVKNLSKSRIKAVAIHGNKSQSARLQALKQFRSGKVRVLVATDIASRGLDVEGITHVINYELPNEAESYVHRIGRTARAGAQGVAISFCDAGERGYLREIEKVTNRVVTVMTDHPFHSQAVASSAKRQRVKMSPSSGKNRNGTPKRTGQPSGEGKKSFKPRKRSTGVSGKNKAEFQRRSRNLR